MTGSDSSIGPGKLGPFLQGEGMKRKTTTQTDEQWLYDATYPIMMAPWHGVMTPVRLRKLTATQAMSCGDFGMIELWEDKIRNQKVPSVEEMSAYAERHDKLCKLAMVQPTYDDAMKIAGSHIDSRYIEKQLSEIKELFNKIERMPEKDMKLLAKLREQYAAIELQSKFILPADFTALIVNYCLGIESSDIKKVTEEMLMNAAILATRGHDNPSDHIGGIFTDLMLREIDNRAWIIFDEKQKKGA